MLRITVHNTPQVVTFQLEGRLTDPWLEELAKCWRCHAIEQWQIGNSRRFDRADLHR